MFEFIHLKNSKESFQKMKNLLETAAKLNSSLSNTSVAICFLFAINQAQFDYAYNLLFKIEKYNQPLIFNLKVNTI